MILSVLPVFIQFSNTKLEILPCIIEIEFLIARNISVLNEHLLLLRFEI